MRPVLPSRVFGVELDLGPVEASVADVRVEVGSLLDGLEPRLRRDGDDIWISLSVPALDLWLALLMAMAAVTATGYAVRRISAQPVELTPVSR